LRYEPKLGSNFGKAELALKSNVSQL
jgi:hypothetical protein